MRAELVALDFELEPGFALGFLGARVDAIRRS
jgi:hypothetical protein